MVGLDWCVHDNVHDHLNIFWVDTHTHPSPSQKLDHARQEHEAHMTALHTEESELRATLSTLRSTLHDLHKRQRDLEQQAADQQDKTACLEAQEARLGAREKAIQQREAAVDGVEAAGRGALEGKLYEAQRKVGTLQARVDHLERVHASVEQAVQAV